MKSNRLALGLFVFAGVGLSLDACIILISVPPPPQQLPSGLFKLHVHIAAEPVTIELPLPGGTSKISLGGRNTDPVADFEGVIRGYEADVGAHAGFADRLDYSAALIFSGRSPDAIAVLLALETDFPGRHAVAANLGTAYELVGDVPNAIIWISLGATRNPESHEGTEWLHLAILEAKQKLKMDKDWLEKHSVLDGSRERGLGEIEAALEYQLNERLYFIKDNDPVMCDLFFEAARTTGSGDKRAYFLRQAAHFALIRDKQIHAFTGERVKR